MTDGKVEAIYIAPGRGEPTNYVEQVHVIPGKGIEGDRYFDPPQASDIYTKTGRELTLIEIETIEALCTGGIQISPDQTRRNIITRGVSLNELVGKTFFIGSIKLHGVRLCEPCNYLANRTDPRIVNAMAHRGGLRTNILTEGTIHLNDTITFPLKDMYD